MQPPWSNPQSNGLKSRRLFTNNVCKSLRYSYKGTKEKPVLTLESLIKKIQQFPEQRNKVIEFTSDLSNIQANRKQL
jgi:hypothetical protein